MKRRKFLQLASIAGFAAPGIPIVSKGQHLDADGGPNPDLEPVRLTPDAEQYLHTDFSQYPANEPEIHQKRLEELCAEWTPKKEDHKDLFLMVPQELVEAMTEAEYACFVRAHKAVNDHALSTMYHRMAKQYSWDFTDGV